MVATKKAGYNNNNNNNNRANTYKWSLS